MEIAFYDNNCIITPLSPKLGKRECGRIFNEISKLSPCKIGLDLSYVKDCTIDFINKIKEVGNVSLFNVPSDIFSILTIMKLDRILEIFTSELDFIENKRRIINRKFVVINQ